MRGLEKVSVMAERGRLHTHLDRTKPSHCKLNRSRLRGLDRPRWRNAPDLGRCRIFEWSACVRVDRAVDSDVARPCEDVILLAVSEPQVITASCKAIDAPQKGRCDVRVADPNALVTAPQKVSSAR